MNSSFAQFSARARVVDLLGRQQIADVPTALGELLKNAIDAGASAVRLDYWPEFGCFSAGDNGLGMRQEEDLLQRWMVLATDSKHGPPSTQWTLYATKDQEAALNSRKAFGEKGIGRLAMALLGAGTIVWTRWGEGENLQRTLLLVPWAVFKHAALTLDQIRLPMLSVDRDATSADATALVDQLESWFVKELPTIAAIPPTLEVELKNDISAFRNALRAPLQFPSTMGTTFFVLGASDILVSHFDGWLIRNDLFGDRGTNESEGRQAYLAFSNSFLPNRKRLDISLYESGRPYLLADENFWEPDDFEKVDHCIEAEIDEQGFARVVVRRHSEKILHETQLRPLPKRARSPGPLSFKIGYVEGDHTNSSTDNEEWMQYTKRLEKFGGFFVYMNDIRVQPYGRANEDFLEFEKYRSLNAGRYFFSHRRMFGGLFLSQEKNLALVEKAGREGFQQTAAYRGMVFWLRSLFVELADTYFGRKAERTDKIERAEEKRKRKRHEREQEAKREFETELNRSRQRLEPAFNSFKNIHEKFRFYLRTIGEQATLGQINECRRYLTELQQCYESLWSGFILGFPDFYTPTANQVEIIDSYLHSKQCLDDQARELLMSSVETVEALAAIVEPEEERKASLTEILNTHHRHLKSILQDAARNASEAAKVLQRSVLERADRDFVEVTSHEIEDTSLSLQGDPSPQTIQARIARDQRVVQEEKLVTYNSLGKWLSTLAGGDDVILDVHDLREEIREAKERESRLLELAQLGLVIESVDHDYHAMLGNIADSVTALSTTLPSGSVGVLDRLVAAVEHLDERLQFWDPLVRRANGVVDTLSGEDIRRFIQGVMDQHSRQNVKMEYTPKFLACIIPGVKRSGFLGALHNIVMNAGYWCTRLLPEGVVRFSMHAEGIVISDSGPGVTERDRTRIFEPGFSRRPSGRGLGLYIAKSTLRGFGCGIRLLEQPAIGALKGANFLITISSRTDYEMG